MPLQGRVLAALTIALALGMVLVTAWLWPRLADRGVLRWLARVGLVLTCQLLAVLLTAITVNNYFDFYSSWGDLLGSGRTTGPQTVQLAGVEGGSGAAKLATVQVDRVFGPAAHRVGYTDHLVVRGPRSQIAAKVLVYLPPQYRDPRYAETRFPVTMVIAGYPGHIGTLVRSLEVPRTMNEMLAQGRVRPTILVMVSPTVAPPRDTECADVPGGPQVETWLSQEVPQAVAARYRVTGPGGWGVLGVSTGGFCAVKLGLRHPDVFCCVVGMSGYLRTIIDATTGDLYGNDPALRQASDPLWRIANLPAPRMRILLTVSRAERTLYQQVQAFVAAARPPLQVATLVVDEGGHNFGVWVNQLPTCLQWLSLAMPGAPKDGIRLPELPPGGPPVAQAGTGGQDHQS